MYKPHYQLYELHEINQTNVVAIYLILGGAGFVCSAILNPLKQITLNGGKSHKTASRLPKLYL